MPAPGQKINRPHWKEKYDELSKETVGLRKEIARLRSNGADEGDLVKIKAEAFAAGVAAATSAMIK